MISSGIAKRLIPSEAAPLPQLKRVHLDRQYDYGYYRPCVNFDHSFSDELVLEILSYLSFRELCTAQMVNTHWARLAGDSQLWKQLFIKDHPSQRLRGGRGFSEGSSLEGGPSGREIRPLPARVRVKGTITSKSWKWMYR